MNRIITTPSLLKLSVLSLAAMITTAHGQVDQGGAITASELQTNGYSYPSDLVANASQTQLANYAWRLFIASQQLTGATLQDGSKREIPSSTANFITTGEKAMWQNPLVFEGLYHRTEAFPFYTSAKPPSPIGTVPTYYTYSEDNDNKIPFTVTGENYVNLDETNQISQNMLYYINSKAPDFPVLFMAKVNATETNYVRNKTAPSSDSSFVFPNDVLEIKTAWRRVKDIKNSDPSDYHQAVSTYYVGEEDDGNPQIEQDVFALIAIHIMQKTANYQEFIFTTFEHNDAVTRNAGNEITDPAYSLLYNKLCYDVPAPVTAKATGAYAVNAPGQVPAENTTTTYTLPNPDYPQGSAECNTTLDITNGPLTLIEQPQTITKEVNDVNNAVAALITNIDSNNIWANYRLKGVQAVPTSDETALDFFLANIVVESSQPGIQLFKGDVGSLFNPLTNNRLPGNVSLNLVEGQPVPAAQFTMGGCMGCHGVAQQKGRDFSFLAQASGGKGKEVDSVPPKNWSQALKDAHNKKIAASSNNN